MHPSKALSRTQSVCQICESITSRRQIVAPRITARHAFQQPYLRRQALRPFTSPARRSMSTEAQLKDETSSQRPIQASSSHPPLSRDFIKRNINRIAKVSTGSEIPSEDIVRDALDECYKMAEQLTDINVQVEALAADELAPTASPLLSLDAQPTGKQIQHSLAPRTRSALLNQLIDQVSETAYEIIAHPPVIITPALLTQYVSVQAKLGRPETLPRVFDLYASKPVPQPGTSPLTYKTPNANNAARAIEADVITTALDTSIEAKNIDAAVGIIESSYGTKAFVRSKLLRHGLLPIFSMTATPVAAYVLASQFAAFQQAMDDGMATGIAFAGILTYVGFTGAIGLVTVMTRNDQMNRVTWAPGIPLRERWIREDERAALDKIACAWGFKEKWRQGEEDGVDWNALKEYIGQKGMILDRTELMEGMQ